jgi:hypothetical protein
MPVSKQTCANCDVELDHVRFSLPMNERTIEFVPVNDTSAEWVAVASCEMCYRLHAAAGAYGEAVLEAYREHRNAVLTDTIEAVRGELASIEKRLEDLKQ